jgi:hypothetical protein
VELYFSTFYDKLGLAALLLFLFIGVLGLVGWAILLFTKRLEFSTKSFLGLIFLLGGIFFVGYFCIYQAGYRFFSIEIDKQGRWELQNAYGWVIKSIEPNELRAIDQKTENVWGKSRRKQIYIEIELPDGQKYRSHSSTPEAIEILGRIKSQHIQ